MEVDTFFFSLDFIYTRIFTHDFWWEVVNLEKAARVLDDRVFFVKLNKGFVLSGIKEDLAAKSRKFNCYLVFFVFRPFNHVVCNDSGGWVCKLTIEEDSK